MSYVLGARGAIGGVLGQGRGGAAAAQWWLAGGVSAANCVAAYQPIGAASLAASYTNLANPGTYNAAPGVAPTFAAAMGWTFNGTQYLNSGVVPGSGYSMLVRFSGAPTGSGNVRYMCGVYNGNGFMLAPTLTGTARRYWYGNGLNTPTGQYASGVMGLAGPQGYYNGAADVATGGTWVAQTRSIHISGYQNTAGANDSPFVGNIQAIAIYNTTVSAAQVAAISSAMAALTG